MVARKFQLAWLLIGFLLFGCAREGKFASGNIVTAFGGSPTLTTQELECVQKRPKLNAALKHEDSAEFSRALAEIPRDRFECFGQRVVDALFDDTEVGRCWKRVVLDYWGKGIEKRVSVPLEKAFVPALNQCGPFNFPNR
jgi:hypothetical protein